MKKFIYPNQISEYFKEELKNANASFEYTKKSNSTSSHYGELKINNQYGDYLELSFGNHFVGYQSEYFTSYNTTFRTEGVFKINSNQFALDEKSYFNFETRNNSTDKKLKLGTTKNGMISIKLFRLVLKYTTEFYDNNDYLGEEEVKDYIAKRHGNLDANFIGPAL